MADLVSRFIDWYENGVWDFLGEYAFWVLVFAIGLLFLTAGLIGIHSRRTKGGES